MRKVYNLLFHFLQILLLLALILAAIVAYRSINTKIDTAVAEIKVKLISRIESQYNIRLEYDSISPSFLNSIHIKNIDIYAKGRAAPMIHLDSLKLYHDLPGLLFRGDTVIKNVSAVGLNIEIDEQRDKIFLDNLATRQGGSGVQGLNGIFTQYIRIRNWEASYRNESFTALGQGDLISMRQLGQYARVSMEGQLSYQSQTGQSKLEYLSLETALKGTLQNDFSAFSLDSDFRKIDTNLAVVENQRLNINYSDDQLRVTKIKDTKPYDLNFLLDNDEIRLIVIAENFSPSQLVYFNSELENMNPWLKTVMSGNAEFTIQRDTGFINYSYKGGLQLNNDNLPFPLKVSVDVEGDDLHIVSDELRVSSPKGSINIVGQWVFQNGFPEGDIHLSQINLGENEHLSGILQLRNIDEYLSVSSRNLRLSDNSNPGTIKSLVYKNEDNYVFSLMTDLAPDNTHWDRVVLDGNFSLSEGLRIQSSFRATDLLVSSLSPYLPEGVVRAIDSSFSELMLQSEGTLSYSPDNLIVQLKRFQTFLPDGSKSLSLSGFYGEKNLELYSVELNWDDNYLLGSGQASFLEQGLSISSGWNLNNNKYELNALYQNGQFSLKGNHGLKLQLAGQGGSRLLGTFAVEELPVTWNGENYLGSLNLRGRYEKDNWEVFLSDSSFRWTSSELLRDPELNITAFFAPGVANLFSLRYTDSFASLEGEGNLFYDIPNAIYNGSLVLGEDGGAESSENYDLYAAYSEGRLSLTAQITQARSERFSNLNMTGRVDSRITVQGSIDSPVVEGSINAPVLELNKNPFAIKANLRLSARKLELFDLNIQRNNLYLKRGLGVFDLKDGSLVFTTSLANRADSNDDSQNRFYLESGFSVKAETGLSVDFKNIEVPVLEDFSGRFRLHPVKWNGLTTFASKTIDFSMKGANFESVLLEDPEQFIRFNSENGQISANLKDDFPIAMSVEGIISEDKIDLNIDHLITDLNVINYVMPNDRALKNRYVVFKKGSLMEGSAHIGGTMEDPVFNGRMNSKNLFLLTPYTEASIEETFIEATVKDSLVQTNEFYVPIGKGGIRGQGYMNMRGWGIKDYNLDISAEGSPGTPISYNAYGLQGTGAVTGQFRFYGDNRQGNFDGRVVLDELVGSFGEKTEITARNINRANKYAFRLNLDVVTGKNVLFVLPNPQVELVRATAEPGELLNISVDSLNKTLSMTGGISLRDGEIYYFDRTFEISEGSLTFNEDEETFNPFLNIEAEIDTTDASGTDVTIYLVYRNPVRDDFIPILRSNPSMQEDEILALFGQSLIPVDSSGEVDISNILLATGGMVSQYGFVRPLEQSIKDSLNLDTVTIRTQVLENAIVDQLNRESSTTDVGTTFSMTKYLDDTSIYLGKFAGESLYFSAGMVVDYDQLYGLGSYFNGIRFVPDLTIEMRTPFFLVFWNYNKRNAFDFHNTDLMKNNAIGFEWRYSY